jgi:prephenate dehydrogenase
MWGTENSGPGAAMEAAFEGRAAVICDSRDSDADALEWVTGMYRKIGMRLVEMNADAHDLHTAYISHVSHITSFALANTVLEKEREEQAIFELASGGFESTVRLAKSSPAMWVPIFLHNRDYMIDVIKEHIAQLDRFRSAIEEADTHRLWALIDNANRIRRILK